MGLISVGRRLFLQHLICSGAIVALGAFAFVTIRDLQALVDASAAVQPDLLPAAIRSAAIEVLVAAGILAGLMIALLAFLTRLQVTGPLQDVVLAAEQLAAGHHDVAIGGDLPPGEFAALARSLGVLRDAAAARSVSKTPAPADAISAPSRLLGERIESFSRDLAGQVRRLADMTQRVHEAADQVTGAARHASQGSDHATNASSNAASDVSSVATASEQLLDSIEEISRQVVQSTNVVRVAVEHAVDTNAGMGRLSAAAQKVGDVVSLISRIAAQTNLLALNATIEAARAGEAGRGFAVVAQEVKTLATQTAKATQDISGQIAEMQEATDLSVDAIDKIQTKISEVEHISTIIASAVHEQGAATQEIARNVRSAAAGTATMSSQIENVVRSVGETSASAASISALARELDEIASSMTAMVGAFTRALNAA